MTHQERIDHLTTMSEPSWHRSKRADHSRYERFGRCQAPSRRFQKISPEMIQKERLVLSTSASVPVVINRLTNEKVGQPFSGSKLGREPAWLLAPS